ncbi:hypothetical protein [Citrobacter koseri]|uniref:hypothetical protein n=1 Tax=Citrobacter koseri TaxID=545 RepID=UPI003EE107D8
MKHAFEDMQESNFLTGYASQIIEAIQDDVKNPGLYDDIYSFLQEVKPTALVTLGNPAITAPAAWWGAFFGLSIGEAQRLELAEIEL